MISNHIFTFTLCGIIYIFTDLGAKAAPLNEEVTQVEDKFIESNLHPLIYVDEEELTEPIYNDYTDRKFKRQSPIGNRQSIEEILPRLPISSRQVQELLRRLNKPKKSEVLTLNGWSASGMPFNVLYTPNILQQKMLSSFPERKTVSLPTPEPLRHGNYVNERKEPKKEGMRPGMKTSAKGLQMRKHYLVIPQLFVSYGWGSLGK